MIQQKLKDIISIGAMAARQYCELIFLVILANWVSYVMCRLHDHQQLIMVNRHEEWMAQYGRIYKDSKAKARSYMVFKENVKHIEDFNNGVDRGYKLGLNKFADLTNEEFRDRYTGYRRQISKLALPTDNKTFRYANVTEVPGIMDWRDEGVVTGVKEQGTCGGCWAFSAVAAVEGVTRLKTGKLVSLSEQELLDCDVNSVNEGCAGGIMESAYEFIQHNGGITTEANYPYKGLEYKTCKKDNNTMATITGYENVPANDEMALLQAVANQPVSVAIEGSGEDFRFYSSGVFMGKCRSNVDHAVTIVGYGSNNDGVKYWLVKNSWGTEWGVNGFMMIQRDVDAKEGLCGIATGASYPTV